MNRARTGLGLRSKFLRDFMAPTDDYSISYQRGELPPWAASDHRLSRLCFRATR